MHTYLVDLSLAEIMSGWPSTIRLFLDKRMHCVGCPIAPFHTLVDAAEEHGLLPAELVADVEHLQQLEIAGPESVAEEHQRVRVQNK